MAGNCYLAYKKALPNNKRMLNQAFFEKIYLKGNDISGFEYTEPFKNLMSINGSINNTLVDLIGHSLNSMQATLRQLEAIVKELQE